jgi:nucleotide-binding universal stress UspA family protein
VDVTANADLELVVVHVDDEDSIPSFSDQVAHETDSYAEEFLARYLHGAPKARLELRVGVPADEIIAAADAAVADVLAIGWPQSRDEQRGAVACEVLDRSRIPVLLIALDKREEAT